MARQKKVYLLAGVDPGALFKSEDSGKTWTEFKALSDHPTRKQWNPGAGGLMVHIIVLRLRILGRSLWESPRPACSRLRTAV